jgi:hypothetical protein
MWVCLALLAGAPADLVGTTIVLVGVIDPMVVQPAHLASNGLLAEGDLAQLRYDPRNNQIDGRNYARKSDSGARQGFCLRALCHGQN